MISAFGVEHGEIAKSWAKLAPKLTAARNAMPQFMSRSDTMVDRTARNYAVMRKKAGEAAAKIKHEQDHGIGGPTLKPYRIKQAKKLKDMANASITGHANAVRRSGTRALP